jgi:hypothetical protein
MQTDENRYAEEKRPKGKFSGRRVRRVENDIKMKDEGKLGNETRRRKR